MSQQKRFNLPDKHRTRRERNNPSTPLPLTPRDTDKLDYLRRIGMSYEDTDGEMATVPSAKILLQSVYRKRGLEPTVLLFSACRAHVLQQNDRKPPTSLYVCQQLYNAIRADIELQSSEEWDGKYKFPMYDRDEPASIPIGVDIVIHQSVPTDTVICIH